VEHRSENFDRGKVELSKWHAETLKLHEEMLKLNREARKLDMEMVWYPVIAGATAFVALMGVMLGLIKLLFA